MDDKSEEKSPNSSTSVKDHAHTNELIHETSPYLLQHAHNPVNWMPWGPAAFAKAKEENKPIFLSVGYSTCYWCHVMERESFEKEDVAEILNEHFIPVKVDREERPEVDQQYMMATQLVTGRGGWPNSVWLTPDGRPWMAGTYFPREQFKQILLRLSDLWDNRHEDVLKQAESLTAAIEKIGAGEMDARPVSRALIDQAIAATSTQFDATNGGFGTAPKFPPHANLALLIDQYRRGNDPQILKMIEVTLTKMGQGGVYDQLGGGFHRYATDGHWLLPHFEKMLYDNGQLMRSYTDGWLLTENHFHREIVEGIYVWLDREMTSPEGGFYSAIDSESDAEEGKFYVWTYDEIIDVLGEEDGKQFAQVYNAQPGGNFKEEATGHQSPNNVLHLTQSIEEFAQENGLDPESLHAELTSMRKRLLDVRQQREYPHLDDKILAAWNGLMIEGLAYAGRKLDEPKYIDAAEQAAHFLLEKMVKDGKLQRTYRSGQAKLDGYLTDYAFVSRGLIELYRATNNDTYLDQAQRLADVVLAEFDDPENGGFYFTAKPADDKLAEFVIRSKNLGGGGNLPSGNGVMAVVLLDLSQLVEDQSESNRYKNSALRTLGGLSGFMNQTATQADHLLIAAAAAMALDDTDQMAAVESSATKPSQPSEGTDSEHTSSTDPDAKFSATAVEGTVYLSKLKLLPGEKFQIAVRLKIEDGYHLYGPNPDVEVVRPTRIEWAESNLAEAVEIKSPKGETKHDEALDQELEVYHGRITFLIDAQIPDTAEPGKQQLEFTMHTQACTEKQCAAPDKNNIQLDCVVMPANEAPQPDRHPQIFANSN